MYNTLIYRYIYSINCVYIQIIYIEEKLNGKLNTVIKILF